MFTKDIELKRFRRTIAKGSFLAFAISLIVINGVASATSSGITSANETIGKWEVYEVTLITTNSYSNPYKDVTLSATFNGPGGEELTLESFWDGGNTWKVRMAPTKVGTWTYTTTSSDDQLNGTTGTFETVSSDKKGFIKVNPDYPYSFMYDDGTPFFWMGDTLWDDPGYNRFKDYIDLISSHGYNSYHTIVAHDRYDYQENEGGAPFEMIYLTHRNYDRLRPEFFQEFDKRVIYANSKGLMPQFFLTWSKEFVNWDRSQYERYVRYMIARYAAYDVVWVVSGEYDHPAAGPPPPSDYTYHGNVIYQRDPYRRPISIHPMVSSNEFGNDAWLTYVMLQSNHISFDYDEVHAAIINNRAYNKPVVDGEPEYLRQDTGITIDGWRKTAWSTVLAGGYFDTGYQHIFWDPDNHYGYTHSGWNLHYPANMQGMAQMKYLYDFFQKVEFWNMSLSDNLVTSGTAYCLANIGQEYVIYLPDGGSVNVDLSDATGTLDVEWYNPKDGTYYDDGTVTGGGRESFTPPFSGDAVLHIESTVFDTGKGTYPSIFGTHNGTIKPSDNLTVQKMYTYPCPGTGGHSEYMRLWNASGTIAEGNWSGYEGDWHTISFDKPFILKANETYNYTIRTGSYPQIIHKPKANVTGGTITCEEFVDANGKSYNDWIPVIKLYSAGVASGSSSISEDMVHAGGNIEPPATVLYNSNNSARNRLLNALKSIKGLYNRLFDASKLI
jgi:hypothetical protein